MKFCCCAFKYTRNLSKKSYLTIRNCASREIRKMADSEEPCGSQEKPIFLDKYDDVNSFVQQTLRSVVQATKCSNEMPAAGDDFDYYSSYAGFQDVMNIEGKRILHMIQSILKHQNVKINLGSGGGGAAEIEDKFDLLMDSNDHILERVGQWLDEASGVKKQDDTLIIASATPKQYTTASWNKKSPSGSSSTPSFRLLSARNIQRPQMKFKDKVDNSRLPFRPYIKHKYHARLPLEDSLKLPKGVTPEMTEDPTFLYPHPYQFELAHLDYPSEQLESVKPTQPLPLDETPCIYVEKEKHLEKMLADLKNQKEIAVDLEHHSYRTFQGFTCLMQISTRETDYLVDTLSLRSELHIINEVFTNPAILKVLHGAEMDISWLMRDLGVYVVNMFDTGQACRAMNFTRFSLAHLLQHYCGVTANKQFQLADWRIRPLPEELLKYAREDTHYLLYIYDKMKNDLLDRGNENKNQLMSVLQKSMDICGKVYRKPVFTENSYRDVIIRKKRMFNSQQMKALQDLYAWRDQTARQEDESCGYILPNHMLLQICDILPRESQGVLACCNPIPPLVRQYLTEIHSFVMKARETPLFKITPVKVRKPSTYQHPKYNVDSLLNCPHDLSHAHAEMADNQQTSLLDSSLISQQSTVYPELSQTNSDIVVLKEHPLLSVFDYSRLTCLTINQKKAEILKSEFISPYLQFMPNVESSVLKARKLSSEETPIENWKLLPVSGKRKERDSTDTDAPVPAGPPAKRSRTDLHEVNKHVRFDDDGNEITETDQPETYEKTEDDMKALPDDVEIPLRFQLPSKKKKKKNSNRDVDILEAVQKHLSNIRKLHEENERALGQNSGDEQPLEPKEVKKGKKDKKLKEWKNRDKDKAEEVPVNSQKSEAIVIDDSESDEVTEIKVTEMKEETSNENLEEKSKQTTDIDTDADAIVIADSEDEKSVEEKQTFKPYDYTEGAKQLIEGGKKDKKKEYFNPMGRMKFQKGSKGSKNKGHMKQGSKSLTYRR